MKSRTISFLRRFRLYQRERFPIVALLISLIPAVLSSGAVAVGSPALLQCVIALIASVLYLLHIRIIDEHRDFGHDNEHYKSRPIQIGVISKKELQRIDLLVLFFIVFIAAVAGVYALGVAVTMLIYSYIAGKEFFQGEKLRRHFFAYNSINLVQMLLMQILVYALFIDSVPLTLLILSHFLFTSTGTIIFEFLRKLKVPGEDGTGRDTYTWYLGFSKALWIYLGFFIVNTALFLWIMSMISSSLAIWVALSVVAMILATTWILVHFKYRNRKTEQLLQLSFLLQYGILNLIIYLVII